MLEGGFVIEDRLVTLADIDVARSCRSSGPSTRSRPPPACARSGCAAPRADVYELALRRRALRARRRVDVERGRPGRPSPPGRNGARATASCRPRSSRVPDDDASLERAPEVRNRVGYGLELAGARRRRDGPLGARHRAARPPAARAS